jgi:putative glycosyltransferase
VKLSVVTTLYQSAQYVEEFCRRAGIAASKVAGDDYEIIMVNDGSPDISRELAIRLSERDPHLAVVDLSRNFGHHKAMMTGLAHARGELVFLIDSDLEEEPEWLANFFIQMTQQGCDVVYGVQKRRRGKVFERWSGHVFYRVFRFLTQLDLPENIVVARLMTRRYTDALLRHDEREVFMAGLWLITGFAQSAQLITKHSSSNTTYTLRHKMLQFVDSVTSFSNAPLIGIFFIGCLISLLSGFYIAYLVVHWLFLAKPPGGWTSVMASVWFLSGSIIAFIGVIGIYLSKVFSETKRRPYTIVREVYGRTRDEAPK